jgi:hypothetical protein
MQGIDKYITIKEASKLTGKHPDTIRRLWQDDKGQVIPKIQAKYTQRDKQNRLLIDSEWLISQYEPITSPTSNSNNGNNQSQAPAPNQAMDSVILGLQQIIHNKEANTTKLQDQFQQLLATQQLPAPAQTTDTTTYEPPQAEVVTTEVEVPMQEPEMPKQTPKKPRKKTKAKPKNKTNKKETIRKASEPEQPKKSWWRR